MFQCFMIQSSEDCVFETFRPFLSTVKFNVDRGLAVPYPSGQQVVFTPSERIEVPDCGIDGFQSGYSPAGTRCRIGDDPVFQLSCTVLQGLVDLFSLVNFKLFGEQADWGYGKDAGIYSLFHRYLDAHVEFKCCMSVQISSKVGFHTCRGVCYQSGLSVPSTLVAGESQFPCNVCICERGPVPVDGKS